MAFNINQKPIICSINYNFFTMLVQEWDVDLARGFKKHRIKYDTAII